MRATSERRTSRGDAKCASWTANVAGWREPLRTFRPAAARAHGAFAWVGSRVLHRTDLLRGGERSLTTFATDFPLCFLTTTGRRAAAAHGPLLWVPGTDSLVVIGSNWGRKSHPAWALNLDAEPAATVAVDGVERQVRARRASGEERERYWAQACEIWPGYEGYSRRAGREIRVYVLEPA